MTAPETIEESSREWRGPDAEPVDLARAESRAGESRRLAIVLRVVAGLAALGLFVAALDLMKTGAGALIPTLEGSLLTDSVWSTLGMGWLGACLVLSGSPVAAASLTLLSGGAIDRSQAFTMLTGSRLGASFVVLVVGFMYAVRRPPGSGRRKAPLTIGVLALAMTFMAYVPGALLGWVLLTRGGLDGLHLAASPEFLSVTEALFGWMVDLIDAALPRWALFPVGLAVLLAAFNLVDLALPKLGASIEERSDAWYRRTWPMFLLGCGVAMLTLSVSVALTVLVPVVAKGYLRRGDVLPYIAGANITTLADTLAAAVLLGNQDAVRVVVAELLGVAAWTLLLLAVLYPLVRNGALQASKTILASQERLAGFLVVLFSVPVLLILL